MVKLRLLGEHNVRNALAGIAAGLASGIPLDECAAALKTMYRARQAGTDPSDPRRDGANDCYNSNPQALRAMVDTLLTFPASGQL